jgi:hypothetical protein
MVSMSGGQISVDLASDAGLESSNPGNAAGQLRVKLDGSTLSRSASGLKVATGGITNTEVSASAAIAYSKLALSNSIVNADISASAAIAYSKLNLSGTIVNADISASAAIAYSKLNLTNSIVTADLTSGSVDETKLSSSVAGQGLVGGAGSPLAVGAGNGIAVQANAVDVIHSPLVRKTFTTGEAFAANTSFLVRLALNGETAGKVYKATSANAVADGKFWAIGMAIGTGQVAGQDIDVILLGTHTLGSSDSTFAGADIGKAVWLTTAGAFSVTSPSSSGDASFRVGSVEDTNKVFIDGKQLTGIN